MRNYVKILFLLIILFSSCKNDIEMIEDFSVDFIDLNDNRGVVGKEILCILNFEGVIENDDEIYASYFVEGGTGNILINENWYEQNQEFDLRAFYDKKISFIYLPKVEGTHSLTISIKKKLKGQVLERYAYIVFQIDKIEAYITGLKSDVDIGNTTQFFISIDVDMKVFCKACFLKGAGDIKIENTDIVENRVLLQKDNKVLLTPKSIGECRLEFEISDMNGRLIKNMIVVIVVQ